MPAARPSPQATLTSKRPALRRAAAATLRHLAERDPAAILPQQVEVSLFQALDAETDAQISAQLKATLATLLQAGASAQPSYWITMLGGVVQASGSSANRCAGPCCLITVVHRCCETAPAYLLHAPGLHVASYPRKHSALHSIPATRALRGWQEVQPGPC
jgi:hypothetical protein